MVLSLLLAGALLTSIFVGVNVGGSAAGESFGPAVGSRILKMRTAALLMGASSIVGGVLVGRHVVETMGKGIVPAEVFTLPASIAVLLFTGLGILVGNLREVSVSTSETAVAAIAGMGIALGVARWDTLGVIVMWWFVSPVLAFWLSVFVGRYLYDALDERLDLEGRRRTLGKVLVVIVGLYMGFSAGASNVANAVAPLVGAGVLPLLHATLLGGAAMAVGAYFIGPRTIRTVGEEITHLPVTAALVVELIAATIITLLSWGGIPASLAITTISCVIGLGWGRATRDVTVWEHLVAGDLTGSTPLDPGVQELFDPATTRHVVTTWVITPTVAGALALSVFWVAKVAGVLG